MASFNKFYQTSQNLADGVYDLSSDTLKVALSNTLPINTNAVLADISEIPSGNGYVSGGNTAAVVSCVQTLGVLKLVLSNTTFAASGGSIGPLRYAVLYDSTPTSPLKPLLGWFDNGSSITLTSGTTLAIVFNPSTGALTIA